MTEKKKPTEDKLIDKPMIPFAIEIKGPLRETQIANLVKALCETVSTFLIDNTTIKKYTRISSDRQELNKVKQLSHELEALKKKLESFTEPLADLESFPLKPEKVKSPFTQKELDHLVAQGTLPLPELPEENKKALTEAVEKEFPEKAE